MPVSPSTPIKASLDFMEFSRPDTMDLYQLIKLGMIGNAQYPTPTISFASIDAKVKNMYIKVKAKDFRGAVIILESIKSDLRSNATYVQENSNNDVSILVTSGYHETIQGGAPSPEIGQVMNVVPSNGRLSGTIATVYDVPKGTHLLEGEVKLHTEPDTAFAFAASSDNKKMLFETLTKNTEIDIRIRAKGTLGYGEYSQVVTIIVK